MNNFETMRSSAGPARLSLMNTSSLDDHTPPRAYGERERTRLCTLCWVTGAYWRHYCHWTAIHGYSFRAAVVNSECFIRSSLAACECHTKYQKVSNWQPLWYGSNNGQVSEQSPTTVVLRQFNFWKLLFEVASYSAAHVKSFFSKSFIMAVNV